MYIVGATGGCAAILRECLLEKRTIDETSQMFTIDEDLKIALHERGEDAEGANFLSSLYDTGAINQLNNGLSEEDNLQLLHSTNVTEIVALILQGLMTKLNEEDNGNA